MRDREAHCFSPEIAVCSRTYDAQKYLRPGWNGPGNAEGLWDAIGNLSPSRRAVDPNLELIAGELGGREPGASRRIRWRRGRRGATRADLGPHADRSAFRKDSFSAKLSPKQSGISSDILWLSAGTSFITADVELSSLNKRIPANA